MYLHYELAKVRHEDLLRAAAQQRLAAQARQGRSSRRPNTRPTAALRRLSRAWQRLAPA
jgi:hypothetical protein